MIVDLLSTVIRLLDRLSDDDAARTTVLVELRRGRIFMNGLLVRFGKISQLAVIVCMHAVCRLMPVTGWP